MVRQRSAKPLSPVQIRVVPPNEKGVVRRQLLFVSLVFSVGRRLATLKIRSDLEIKAASDLCVRTDFSGSDGDMVRMNGVALQCFIGNE